MCFGSEVQDRQDGKTTPRYSMIFPPLTDVFHQRVQCTARKSEMQWGLAGYPEHPERTRPCATTWPWPVHFCSQVASHGQPTSAAAQLSCESWYRSLIETEKIWEAFLHIILGK